MNIEQEINKVDKVIEESKRSLAQAEGKIEVATESLRKLGVSFENAAKEISKLTTNLEELDLDLEDSIKRLNEDYEW